MRNRFRILLIMFAVLTIFGIRASSAIADGGGQYCATPPFVQANLPSNIMLVLDYSGSMSWHGYADTNSEGSTASQTVRTDSGYVTSYYHPDKTYYGYFKPDKYYDYDYNGYYYITSNPGRYSHSGNYLNWYYMTRIALNAVVMDVFNSSASLPSKYPEGPVPPAFDFTSGLFDKVSKFSV